MDVCAGCCSDSKREAPQEAERSESLLSQLLSQDGRTESFQHGAETAVEASQSQSRSLCLYKQICPVFSST